MNQSDDQGDQVNMPDTRSDSMLPSDGRLMGIDFGTVRVGIAICDENQSIASPLEIYTRRKENLDKKFFVKLVADHDIVGFVVGLPLHMSGDESQKSEEARAFGLWLHTTTGIAVDWIDERFSTAYANELLAVGNFTTKQRKARLDKVAAQAILATYLESDRTNRESAPIDD